MKGVVVAGVETGEIVIVTHNLYFIHDNSRTRSSRKHRHDGDVNHVCGVCQATQGYEAFPRQEVVDPT